MDKAARESPDDFFIPTPNEELAGDPEEFSAPDTSELPPRIVISLHGIRTRGAWQKELTAALGSASFIHEPLDYGHFPARHLLSPKRRRKKAEWFRDEYTRICAEHKVSRPDLVAHSMGTHIFATALELFPEIVFNRVILCGSIVRRDYPWTAFKSAFRFQRILNDAGSADFWVRVVGFFVEDAGASGAKGFVDDAGGSVVERAHPKLRHSDAFYKLRYRNAWIPFLKGSDPEALTPLPAKRINWLFRSSAVVILIVFACIAWAFRRPITHFIWGGKDPAREFVEGNEAPPPIDHGVSRPVVPLEKRPQDQHPVLRVKKAPLKATDLDDVIKQWNDAKDDGSKELASLEKDLVGRPVVKLPCEFLEAITNQIKVTLDPTNR